MGRIGVSQQQKTAPKNLSRRFKQTGAAVGRQRGRWLKVS
jgi:hypothetical protein